MKAAIALRPRERRLALIAAILIGCWVFVSWVVLPLFDLVGDLRLRVDAHTEWLGALSRLLAQAPDIERDYRQYAGYLETADDEQAPAAFLGELEALARRSNVQLNLKPRPGKREERLSSRFEVELDVEGSQQSLMAFLDELFRLPKLITVERLRISTAPAKPDLLRASLVLQKLALHQ